MDWDGIEVLCTTKDVCVNSISTTSHHILTSHDSLYELNSPLCASERQSAVESLYVLFYHQKELAETRSSDQLYVVALIQEPIRSQPVPTHC